MRTGGEVTAHGSGGKTFACHCPVDPARVWAALTQPTQTAAYLYGLALHSTWVPEAPIDVRHENRPALTGRVLCSRRNERLSYVLHSEPDDPPVYLTWLVRTSPGGCTIRLQIDEIDCADAVDDAEDTWLPVLAALQNVLAPS
ncbi:MAG: hypothetical protein QOH14_3248 [Pseudonocardiales bacterium]|jgi:uncharacterized protein YndB with AHSA1/START domain|nr:hypothetical protein [Pseudonocardiales bacterium]